MGAQGVFQAVHAESRLQGIGDPPGEHPPGIPVDDGDPVGKAMRQADVGDVGCYWPSKLTH
jgi:hypothetical protein